MSWMVICHIHYSIPRGYFPLPQIFIVCFMHENHPNYAKVELQALKCIFLGYSKPQKGYVFILSQINF